QSVAGLAARCRATGGGLRRLIPPLLLERTQAGDVLVVLLQRPGEYVPAVAIRDEIELVGAGGIGDRFQRGTAGIGDRRRRQAVDHVGVVRRRRLDVRAIDWPVRRTALAAEKAVEDGRIG